jgi:P27 family predicted phage terminase small subunit
MRTGRPPTPTKVHQLKGTFRPSRHTARAGEPVSDGALSAEDPPAWMTAGQRDLWKYAIANSPSGLLTPLDGPLLSVWCIAADMHQTACAAQAKRDANGFGPGGAPLLAHGKDGGIIASHYLRVIDQAAARMLKAGSELGFSPGSRPRLAAGGPKAAETEAAAFWGKFNLPA